jgi:predicted nuclease of restriction endonuclease-like RecB superfamily
MYEVESENGTMNLIQSGNVIDVVKQTSGQERKEIENIIRKIDFANGDIHHFLRHLAQGMAMDM